MILVLGVIAIDFVHDKHLSLLTIPVKRNEEYYFGTFVSLGNRCLNVQVEKIFQSQGSLFPRWYKVLYLDIFPILEQLPFKVLHGFLYLFY